jgi:hypothetical protein
MRDNILPFLRYTLEAALAEWIIYFLNRHEMFSRLLLLIFVVLEVG